MTDLLIFAGLIGLIYISYKSFETIKIISENIRAMKSLMEEQMRILKENVASKDSR